MRMLGRLSRTMAALAVAILMIAGVPGAQHVPVVGSAVATPEADAAYINCYTESLPGIWRGERGYWHHRFCFDTLSGCWVQMSRWWTPGNQHGTDEAD